MATASLSVQADEMECSVCHEHFKEPKVLPCGHVLCRHCLLSWLQSQVALCPLCRCPIVDTNNRKSGKSVADIADSFLTDRAMAALVEAHRLLSEQHVCCVCDNVAAVSMCMDCGDMFCQHCSNVHKKQSATKLHSVEQLSSLTEKKLAANHRRACHVHPDKLPEVFCPSHGASVCLRCATTVHRQCPDVKDLEERVRVARDTLHELTVILTARDTEVGRDITRLDQQLTDIDRHTLAAIAELAATFDRIEAAVKASRRRLNDLIVKASSDEKRSVSDVKNIRLDQRGKLTSHKRLVARSEAIITRDDVTDMTPEMETLVKDLDRSITSHANVKVAPGIHLVIDPEELTRIEKALSELGKVKVMSADDEATAGAFRFHDNHEKMVVLSNDKQTAAHRGGFLDGDGIVMSCDPMEVNKLYEVQLTKIEEACAVCVGVVTSSPDSLTLPDGAWGLESAVAVYRDGFYDHGDWTSNSIGQAGTNLKADSRVGVSFDSSRRLHLHVNGDDQGVVPCRSLPDTCWALWELNCTCSAIKSLPVANLS
ncbi:tripartite motif-containing protein 59-like [Littorina saxatilis]|uniref:tripartite motif-containing protein 59-like n=1 Tax=Littorina saxatilis TaxID=31220 RepID=UPI0038B5FCE8